MSNKFCSRPLIELNNEVMSKIPYPQYSVVVGLIADGTTFKIDIGRICYTSRKKDSGSSLHNSKRYTSSLVDKSTLSMERIKWLRKYLLNLFEKGLRSETVRGILYTLRYFINFCDFKGSKPLTLNDLISNYKYYQVHLYQKSRLSGKKGASSSTLYHKLSTARDFIQIAFNLSNSDITRLIPKHRYTGSVKKERQSSQKDFKKYIQTCITYFNEFSDALLNNRYPIPITTPNSTNKNLYWDSGNSQGIKYLPNCFDHNGVPLPFDQVKYDLSRYFINEESQKSYYKKTFIDHRNEWINEALSSKKVYAYNLCTACFYHIYLAFTAANIQPTLDLKISDLDIDSLGLKTFAKKHKYRSGRDVEFSAPTQLKRYLIKYLRLRDWVDNLGLETEHNEYLFLRIGENYQPKRFARDCTKSITGKSILFKDVNIVSSKDIRNLCAEYFVKHSRGNLSLVARKLNNSLATVAIAYTAIDIVSQSIEMNQYHEKISSKILTSNRINKQSIPVKLSTHYDSERIPAGSCSNISNKEPLKAEGFNSKAPNPSCATFESCLFCEFFSVHLDFEDIHKLLSLKEALLKSSLIRNDPEHHVIVIKPSLDRIDEIINYLKNENDNITDLIDEANHQININIYNKYWSKHINFLIKASKSNQMSIKL
ncbi:hypothetical protein [Psychrobacter sp. AOP1-A1-60]|uniref:hypothetical protein n=1 Tax=Psychrobacter sp. AOP1-A1-60 TaxID=3457727 RepID=UPI00403507EF